MEPITGFEKEPYKFLSNMYLFPEPILIQGYLCKSSENYYQAMKVRDENLRQILINSTPKGSKVKAREFDIREDWDEIKLGVMKKALKHKFSIPSLRMKLLATGDSEIIEVNWWNDTYWGVCKGVGENHLGKLLMELRQKIREEVLYART